MSFESYFKTSVIKNEIATDQSENTEYDENDLARWQKGAGEYHKYLAEISHDSQHLINQREVSGPLQAMFLGEKPASLSVSAVKDNQDILESHGFKFVGPYCYKTELVQTVIEQHQDIFKEFGEMEADRVMQKLCDSDLKEFSTVRGLVLGFPACSVKGYEKADSLQINSIAVSLYTLLADDNEKNFLEANYFDDRRPDNQAFIDFFHSKLNIFSRELKINDKDIVRLMDELRFILNGRHVEIQGFAWIDYEESEESNRRQNKLKAAFRESGI